MAELVERPNHPDEMGGQTVAESSSGHGWRRDAWLGSDQLAGVVAIASPAIKLISRCVVMAFRNRKGDKTFLTRAGNFTMDATGSITTDDGSLLLGEGGSIKIDPQGGPIRVDPSGDVIQVQPRVGGFV